MATTLVGAIDAWLAADALTPTSGGGDVGVTGICEVTLIVALIWAWVTVLAGVVEAWRLAGRTSVRPTGAHPVGVRRLVLAACGVALAGGLVATTTAAQAAPAASRQLQVAHVPASQPAAPSTAQATVVATPTAPSLRAVADVVVRRGDCLWSIAASEVQPGAGPMTITARWRALYAANHSVIGSDPDLIQPGQQLRMPR